MDDLEKEMQEVSEEFARKLKYQFENNQNEFFESLGFLASGIVNANKALQVLVAEHIKKMKG